MDGGLGIGFDTHKNREIYSPPYLFSGPRPRLTSKDHFVYGEHVRIESPEAHEIGKVHLIRFCYDSHSFNSGQHIVRLIFTPNREQHPLETQMPLSMDLVPPGFYLLFILNKDGVPSMGKTVRLLSQGDKKPAREVDDA